MEISVKPLTATLLFLLSTLHTYISPRLGPTRNSSLSADIVLSFLLINSFSWLSSMDNGKFVQTKS